MFRNPTADLLVVLLIVLLIFGPKRLPGLGKQLGHGIREFKEGITGESKAADEDSRPELTAATPTAVAPDPAAAPKSEAQPAPVPQSPATGASDRESAEIGSSERRG